MCGFLNLFTYAHSAGSHSPTGIPGYARVR